MGHDYLFAAPSLLSGAARTLDIGGQFDDYNDSATPEVADARAAWLDWRAVGAEIWAAMTVLRDDQATETKLR